MSKPKITTEDVLAWHGEDSLKAMAEILADIANGDYKLKQFRDEVTDYKDLGHTE